MAYEKYTGYSATTVVDWGAMSACGGWRKITIAELTDTRFGPGSAIERCVEAFRQQLYSGTGTITVDAVRAELRGRNLACWCKQGEPCHADVLLRVANV